MECRLTYISGDEVDNWISVDKKENLDQVEAASPDHRDLGEQATLVGEPERGP
jgi:hypothetical protein